MQATPWQNGDSGEKQQFSWCIFCQVVAIRVQIDEIGALEERGLID
jgi:hypothetical protein